MAITPLEVLDPRGPILPDWFGGYVEAWERIEIYLAQAYAKPEIANAADQDAAAMRWAEYRAYRAAAAAREESAGVKSVTLEGQGSYTMESGAQSRRFATLAQDALYGWRLLTAAPEVSRSADGRYASYAWESPEGEVS